MRIVQPPSLKTACILSAMLMPTNVSHARSQIATASTLPTLAEKLFEAAQSHMGVEGIRRVMIRKGELRETDYELADRGRFATSLVDASGRLLQFSVNSPDDRRIYKPIKNRGIFIRRILRIVSPDTPAAEQEWAVKQLDDPVRQWTPSFPIVVGGFVYRLYRANMHDHMEINVAGADTPGWRYPKRLEVNRRAAQGRAMEG